jgi:hypothetical protein
MMVWVWVTFGLLAGYLLVRESIFSSLERRVRELERRFHSSSQGTKS